MLTDVLCARAEEQPESLAYLFLHTSEGQEERLTYGELDRRARSIAAGLQRDGLAGERVLLLYPPGLEFIAAFWGCLYAGVVAVPAYPPRSARTLPRLRSIARDARPAMALTTSETLAQVQGLAKAMPEARAIRWRATDAPEGEAPADLWTPPALAGDDLAFLQYTSGSTASPKGVMVSHANLMHNEEMVRRSFRQSERSVVAGWLPVYHDMGLIGNVLQPLYVGGSCILMSPVAFLQRPRRWLEAISRFRATTSGGPNFAYDLCVRKVPPAEREGLDLSSWEVAFNGAEPVRAETLDRFAEAFAPYGFRREAFYPCYGLAEATLFAAGGKGGVAPAVLAVRAADLEQGKAVPAADGEAARTLVGCGDAWMDQRLAIVDAASGSPCRDGEVGEIWISGPSVARGYWGKAEETEAAFGARLPDGDGPWLRTGDLGFFASGDLFVTGRIKDLIILRGRNHYPQDIELTVERCHAALRPGCGAAFSVDRDGEEKLVLVQELDRQARRLGEEGLRALFDTVRSAVAEQHEVQVHEVVLVSHGTIPKTSSGKLQRHACRAGYLSGSGLDVVARSALGAVAEAEAPAPAPPRHAAREALLALPPEARRTVLDRQIAGRLARLLDVPPASLAPDRPLTAFGLDSLAAVELQSAVEEELGVSIPLSLLLEGATARELVDAVLAGLGTEPGTVSSVPVASGVESGEFPLSYGQRGLWFLDRLAPESAACQIAAAARLHGVLDAPALAAAWRALMLRHPALRTAFVAPEGEPRQLVAGRMEPEVLAEDATAWGEGELRDRLALHAFRPFDLQSGPLLRVGLFRRGPAEHVLLLAVHHLVADFGSLAVLVRELGALAAGEALPPAPELRFTDFTRWEAERLAGPDGERLWAFWRDRLAGLPPLELPADRPHPPFQTFRGDSVGLWLDGAESARVEALGPLFATLLAAFQALLGRTGGQEDFAVGSPASLRSGALREVVGYLVNPIVLRADLAGDPAFSELLARARRRSAEALEHRDLPFPWIAERLQGARATSRSPLFQVLLSFERGRLPEERPLAAFALGEEGARCRLAGWELESLALPGRPAQLELTLVAAELDGRLGFSLQYNADLFDAATAARALGHFRTLLLGAAEEPAQRLSALPLLSEAERSQIAAWNATLEAVPEEPGVHGLIAAQARRTPGATAVLWDGWRLTYAELVEQAARLARTLFRLGVRRGALVGHLCERSPEMLAGLLGVLEAGGAYVPLDPAYPRERLAFMLEDAWKDVEPGRRPVLLTQRSLLGSLPDLAADPHIVCLDDPAALDDSAAPLGVETDPADLAYVIYTSGSTGRPKGVAVSHGAVLNFLATMARQPGLAAGDVLVAVTTLSFDIAGLELYLPLIVGGSVALAPRETAADGALLAAALDRLGATALQATPATWRLLLEAGWRGRPGLKLLCGGEALPRDLAVRLLPLGAELWNVYGPTETTIWSAVHRVEPGEGAVPIGGPIGNTSLQVVDRGFEPAPVGVPGELLIGGLGLARGYLGRPDLTADRFVPDPWAGEPGARLYRTGDLARRRPDGVLECLGRLDHQVKVRGFRIELQEIEARLALHPAVRQGVVVARGEPGAQALVGYLVASAEVPPAELRAFLKETLPDFMVPGRWVFLDALPLTPNGKVDRKALPAPDGARSGAGAAQAAPVGEIERAIAGIWQEVLGTDRVGAEDNFFDLGGHSLLLARVQARLKERLAADLKLVDLFRYPTVKALAARLGGSVEASRLPLAAPPVPVLERGRPEIAVIGMAGRFPGAANVNELWRRLRAGEELISSFSEDELRREGVAADLLADPAYVRAAGVVEDADRFDAAFFGFNPGEATLMDPQHRVFLECAWEALEDAGYDSERHPGRIGVYAGVGINTYLHHAGFDAVRSSAGRYQAFIGNDKDFVPTRVSYKMNLRGPSVNVQTACSSSLVALHLACQALAAGECDMALVGGVSIRTPQKEGYLWEEGGIPSPDGHCRAFDARAQGTVFGNGAGVVVLKRLGAARADGDRVRAVVKGSAINNDGAGKVGYTAPGLTGQAEVIAAALAAAGVEPETVSYVEAHGTGTALGDPIEVAALTEVFAARTGRRGFCALGSVKTNLGHLDTAAGVTGLIKTVLALEHGEIPASLHFETPNPQIDFAGGPFYVNAALAPWKTEGGPRRAGVSSFGIGGTNVHVVLEEAPPAEPIEPAAAARPWQLLVLSARTAPALEEATARLAAHLGDHPDLPLADVAHTLQVGRRAFPHRRVLVCRDAAEAVAALAPVDPERVSTGTAAAAARPVVFLFSGQGAQHAGMARGLYETEPVFRREVDLCAEALRGPLGRDLRGLLFPTPGEEEAAGRELERTELAQPALFTVEYALARLLLEWGVRPDALLGHSVGEYVAACLAGVFSLHDALALVAARGRLMGSLPAGAMLGVDLPEAEVLPRLGPDLALAAVNAPASCVVSGPAEAVAALEGELAATGVRCRRLHTSHAFHSAMMDPILDAFTAEVARVERNPPRLRWVSNVTGDWIRPEDAVDPAYWSRHLRGTVRFADGVRTALAEPGTLLLEVGPGGTLASLARQQVPAGGAATVLAALRHPRDPQPDEAVLLRALGRLWTAGAAVDWQAFGAGERRRRVPLPTYPFERQLFRLKPADRREPVADPLRRKADLTDWFWAPSWRQTAPPQQKPLDPEEASWLLFGGDGLLSRLEERLAARGARVSRVAAEDSFARREAWDALFGEGVPRRIVHAWCLGPDSGIGETRRRAYDSVVALAQALERTGAGGEVEITLLTDGLHRVAGEGGGDPGKALLLGPLRVIPQELPRLRCRAVDVALPVPGSAEEDELASDLAAELAVPPAAGETVVAWRGGERWVRGFTPAPIAAADGPVPLLRPRGVYLITGGFGGIGLTLAEDLARLGARLALVSRNPRTEPVRHLESLGAEVLPLAADVTDEAALTAAVRAAEDRFGPLHGVIHAAGLPGGRLLQLATPEDAARVMAPKVEGTLALHRALGDRPLDFLLLCSSITAALGGVGQSDYCAANAFLDAFARSVHRRGPRRGTATVAVGWDRWEEVGMAARSSGLSLWGASGAPSHPLLGSLAAATPERRVYRAEMRVETHWVLSEHRIAGRPTVPGTTYLEMARAAAAAELSGRPVEIREAVFLAPLALLEGEAREVLTILERDGEGFTFRIASRPLGSADPEGQEHARGKVAAGEAPAPGRRDLPALLAACTAGEITARRERRGDGPEFLVTGPRWQSLQRLHLGEGESVAVLALDPAFAADLESCALHPALLDAAAGAVQFLADGDFLPLAYERLRVWAPLAAQSYSHFRLRGTPGEILTCDIEILDESGAVLAEIEGFSMRRINQAVAAQLQAGRAEASRVSLPRLAPPPDVPAGGIAPREGVEVFRRVLRGGVPPGLVVSTRDLPAAVERAGAATVERLAEELAAAPPAAVHARPEVSSAYAPPADDVERQVAEVWQRVLGIERIGIHDNFFELGGTSLSGVQLVAELKKQVGADIPTVTIFEAPTIAALVRYLRPQPKQESLAESSRQRAEKKMRVLEQARRAVGQRGVR